MDPCKQNYAEAFDCLNLKYYSRLILKSKFSLIYESKQNYYGAEMIFDT